MVLATNSEEAKLYLTLIQGVIGRISSNSASCKTWCVTLVTALFALALDKHIPAAILLGMFPLALFCFLDAYYLSLEQDFIIIYNDFVDKLRQHTAVPNDVYILNPKNSCTLQRLKATFGRFKSFSIWPFYGLILITLLVTYAYARRAPAGTPPKDSPVVSPAGTPVTK